jgi:hypothetical protein
MLKVVIFIPLLAGDDHTRLDLFQVSATNHYSVQRWRGCRERAILFLRLFELGKPPPSQDRYRIVSLRLKPVAEPLQPWIGLYRFFDPSDDFQRHRGLGIILCPLLDQNLDLSLPKTISARSDGGVRLAQH